MSRDSLAATLYKIGSFRLTTGAALALGQAPVGKEFFQRPPAERPLLRVSLHWDRSTLQLILRGGEGPFKLHVYHRAASPLFLLIAGELVRSSKGLRVRSARRFPLLQVAERTLVLDRTGGGVKVGRRYRRPRLHA